MMCVGLYVLVVELFLETSLQGKVNGHMTSLSALLFRLSHFALMMTFV